MRKIEKVIWCDSCGVTTNWEDIANLKPKTLYVCSVGVVVFEDDDVLCLAGNYCEETERSPEQANGIMTIPKCSIKVRRRLNDYI